MGGSDAPGTDTSVPTGPEATFNSQIKDIVARCGGAAPCHVVGAQKPTLTEYAPLASQLETQYTARPGNTNILVTKGKSTGTHSNMMWLSIGDQDKLAAWIDSL